MQFGHRRKSLVHVLLAVRADEVAALLQPRLGRLHLELALAHVVEVLRRAHDQVDDRPDVGEQQRRERRSSRRSSDRRSGGGRRRRSNRPARAIRRRAKTPSSLMAVFRPSLSIPKTPKGSMVPGTLEERSAESVSQPRRTRGSRRPRRWPPGFCRASFSSGLAQRVIDHRRDAGRCAPAACSPTRVAPASRTPRRRSGQQSSSTAWHAQRPCGRTEAAVSSLTIVSINRCSSSRVISASPSP